ncbi:MAG: hypothetical protein AAF219_09105 [Myxococcota bacterium]
MLSVLRTVSSNEHRWDTLRRLLADIPEKQLRDVTFCGRLAAALYRLYVNNDYESPSELAAIGYLDDEYSLAVAGIHGTIEAWHTEFRRFVEKLRAER